MTCIIICLFFFIDRMQNRHVAKEFCPKKEGALASNEFITKFKNLASQNNEMTEEHQKLEQQQETGHVSDGEEESQ